MSIMYLLKFDRPAHFSSESEKLDVTDKKVLSGIWNKIDAMISDNPDLDRDQAMKLLLEKSKENVELLKNGIETMIKEAVDGDTDNEKDKTGPEQDKGKGKSSKES